ncbi:MAG: roadblock/LC7 domain-containing protein [Rhodocyclaceae bacterium]
MTAPTALSDFVISAARDEATTLLNEIDGVRAVVIATIDGFDIASASRGDIDPARIAATASSIAAISSVVSAETQLGNSRSVTIDTDSGFAVIHAVSCRGVDLIIDVVANKKATIGHVNYRVAQLARELERL